jgi:hypothetical protein
MSLYDESSLASPGDFIPSSLPHSFRNACIVLFSYDVAIPLVAADIVLVRPSTVRPLDAVC